MWILVVHRPRREVRGSAAFKLRKIACSREGRFWGYSRTEKEDLRAHSFETEGDRFLIQGGTVYQSHPEISRGSIPLETKAGFYEIPQICFQT